MCLYKYDPITNIKRNSCKPSSLNLLGEAIILPVVVAISNVSRDHDAGAWLKIQRNFDFWIQIFSIDLPIGPFSLFRNSVYIVYVRSTSTDKQATLFSVLNSFAKIR